MGTMPGRLQGVDLWLVDSLVIPASLHDVDGRFVHMNAAAERASGKSNTEMLGKHYRDLLVPEARERVEAQYRHAVETGGPPDFLAGFAAESRRIPGGRVL